jgi:hypothetical protein
LCCLRLKRHTSLNHDEKKNKEANINIAAAIAHGHSMKRPGGGCSRATTRPRPLWRDRHGEKRLECDETILDGAMATSFARGPRGIFREHTTDSSYMPPWSLTYLCIDSRGRSINAVLCLALRNDIGWKEARLSNQNMALFILLQGWHLADSLTLNNFDFCTCACFVHALLTTASAATHDGQQLEHTIRPFHPLLSR